MNYDIEKYLSEKGVEVQVKRNELLAKCIFSGCDSDSKGSEAHLYINKKTGQYHCKKCDTKGNFISLKKHFGDTTSSKTDSESKRNIRTVTPSLVDKLHSALPIEILEYLNARGISDLIIKHYKIGWGEFYGQMWITIPIKDPGGNYSFFKLRQDPKKGKEKMTWPSGIEAQIYDWESLMFADDKIVISEGEMDALLLKSRDIRSVTNTHGANTVKDEWFEHFKKDIEYYICYDNDKAGKTGSLKMADALLRHGCKK